MNTTRTTRLLLLNLVALAILVAIAPNTHGADPFVAGGRSTRAVAVSRGQSDRALVRAAEVSKALGLPGVTQKVARLDDRFEHRTYDEVTSFDGRGREVAITRLDLDGRVVMALVLGWQRGDRPAVNSAAAERLAAKHVAAAGLAVSGKPTIHASAGAGGWSVTWTRVVDGIAVPGDGVRVTLWSDGSFHGLARQERPLAAIPTSPISDADARSAAEAFIARRFAGSGSDALRLVSAELAWLASNDTWDAGRPDAPEGTLRLGWIVRFEATGALAERLRLVQVWVNAADRSILGGDVAE